MNPGHSDVLPSNVGSFGNGGARLRRPPSSESADSLNDESLVEIQLTFTFLPVERRLAWRVSTDLDLPESPDLLCCLVSDDTSPAYRQRLIRWLVWIRHRWFVYLAFSTSMLLRLNRSSADLDSWRRRYFMPESTTVDLWRDLWLGFTSSDDDRWWDQCFVPKNQRACWSSTDPDSRRCQTKPWSLPLQRGD